MIYITNTVYLNDLLLLGAQRNRPAIGWHSTYQIHQVSGDTTLDVVGQNPNAVWSPDTFTRWSATNTDNTDSEDAGLLFTPSGEFDYAAIVGHNFGSAGILYSWQTWDGSAWQTVTPFRSPGSDRPIIDHFDALVSSPELRLFMVIPPGTNARVAHIKIGKLLRLQRPNSGNPAPYGLTKIAVGESLNSDNGQYLGQYITSQYAPWEIDQRKNRPDFVRQHIYPFIEHLNGTRPNDGTPKGTFVAAWLPDDYPGETMYGWKDPNQAVTPRHSPTNELMDWSCDGRGFV